MVYKRKKNQPIETNTELAQMLEVKNMELL